MKVISEKVVPIQAMWMMKRFEGKCSRQKDELGQRSYGGHTLDIIEDSKKAVEVDVKGRVVPAEMRGVGRVRSGEKSIPM